MLLDIVIVFAVAGVATATYWNSLNGEFVFDDLLILDVNRRIRVNHLGGDWRDLWQSRRGYRSLTHWLFRRDMIRHDSSVRGWHAQNIALHSLAAALCYALLRYWYEPMPAGLGAALWAVMPLGTASVSYVSSRSSVLCGVFFLAGIIAFLIGPMAWPLIPAIGYLGWKSKEEIVGLPFAILIVWAAG